MLKSRNADVEGLADWLIGAAPDGGAGQLNGVYRFLLRSVGGDRDVARTEFLAFLRGELSPRMLRKVPPIERGEASYYWQAKKTANGEPFDPEALTCAHKTLAFDTAIRVTHLRNGRSVVCRVNDRGPFTRGRVVDLSRAGARTIGMIETGVAQVALEVLRPDAPARRIEIVAFDTSEASQLGEHLSAVPLL